jgi:hypothetical protein
LNLYDLYCWKYELNAGRLQTVTGTVPTFCVIFQFLTMFNTIVTAGAIGAGAIKAGATSCYGFGSGSTQMMRLLAAQAPQHCL